MIRTSAALFIVSTLFLSVQFAAGGSLAATPSTQPEKLATQPTTAGVATVASPASAEELFRAASPAVVRVEVQDEKMILIGFGSGFFISADGLLVTNFHVIRGASLATVRRADGSTLFVEGIVASDPQADLAVLKIKGANFPFLKLADDQTLPSVGMKVFAIGNPEGLTNTLSEGIISGLRGESALLPGIQTSAAISHGSSGGPLLSADASVIGVTSATFEQGQNLNFAVPAAQVRALLAKKGEIKTLASAAAASLSSADQAVFANVLTTFRKNPTRAITQLNSIRKSQQSNALFWYTMACVHAQLSNKDQAIEAAQKAIQLDPKMLPAHDLLSGIYAFSGQYNEAIAELKTISALSKGDGAAYRRAGAVYFAAGNSSEALRFYDYAIKLDSKDAATYALSGKALGKLDRRDEAIQSFNESLKLDSDNVNVHLDMAETYAGWKQYDKARHEYNAIISQHPDSAMAYLGLGCIDVLMHDMGGARAAWNNATRFDPRGPIGQIARQQLTRMNQLASTHD